MNTPTNSQPSQVPHLSADALTDILRKFEAWGRRSKFAMAQTLGVTMTVIDEWCAGATPIPRNKEKAILSQFAHLCGDYARWMIEQLCQWGRTESRIAEQVGVSPSQIHRWRDSASPRQVHVEKLEAYFNREHDLLLAHWLGGRSFRFLGSKADMHRPDHESVAEAILSSSLAQQPHQLGPSPSSFPFVADVRFEELPKGVHGNTHVRDQGHKTAFEVVLNSEDSRREQERTLFIEIEGHILDYFRRGKATRSAPRRLLR